MSGDELDKAYISKEHEKTRKVCAHFARRGRTVDECFHNPNGSAYRNGLFKKNSEKKQQWLKIQQNYLYEEISPSRISR